MVRQRAATLFAAALLAGAAPLAAQDGPIERGPVGPVDPATQVDPLAGIAVAVRSDDPLLDLPKGTELLSPFGERPIYSPDGTKVAFIGQGWGDAYEIDLATRDVRNLTAHAPGRGFLRVHYLADGNYLLLGPRSSDGDRAFIRRNQIELWFMSKSGTPGLVPLNRTVFEGVATSFKTNRIAWTQYGPGFTPFRTAPHGYMGPDPKPGEYASLWVGDIVVRGRTATIENAREVLRKPRTDCLPEAQDFRDDDRELVFACYRLNGPISTPGGTGGTTGIWGVRLDDPGRVIRYRGDNQTYYSEPEGISRDGQWTLFECSDGAHRKLHICRLDFEPDSRKVSRVTRFTEYVGARVSNPTLAADDSALVFQIARAGDESGVGRGLLLMQLPKP